ncbi:MAG: hypothetical protein K6A23_03610, partial [Butyrivibrio sp.]|nr:hypothetical protein [Butyrivibrio sp.]
SKGIKITSSDSKVFKIGKVTTTTEGSEYSAAVTAVSTGTAVITITAPGEINATKTITVTVVSKTPSYTSKNVTYDLNGLPVDLGITVGNGMTYTTALSTDTTKYDTTHFTLSTDGILTANTGDYLPKAGSKYTIGVVCTVTDSIANTSAVTTLEFVVKVVETKVSAGSVKVTQTDKLNLWYKNQSTTLVFSSSKNRISSVVLDQSTTDKTFGEYYNYTQTEDCGVVTVTITAKDTATTKYKKLAFNVFFADKSATYSVTKNVTLKVENKKPSIKLSSKAVTAYTNGASDAGLIIRVTSAADLTDSAVTFVNKSKGTQSGYVVDYSTLNNGYNYITINKTGSHVATNGYLKFTDDTWSDAIYLPFAVKVNTKSKAEATGLKLSKSSVTLNKTADADAAVIYATDNGGAAVDVTVASVAGKSSSGLIVEALNDGTGAISVSFNGTAVETGSYKYTVTRTVGTKTINKALTVKVIDKAASKSVSAKLSGTIDVYDKTNTYVTVTPKVSGYTGTVTSIELVNDSNSTYAYNQFTTDGTIDADGKAKIYAKDSYTLYAKTKYKMALQYTITNDLGESFTVTTSDITITPKAVTPKFVWASKTVTIDSSSSSPSASVVVTAQVKKSGQEIAISGMTQSTLTDLFTTTYDEDSNTMTITMKEGAAVKKGKTYTIKYNVSSSGKPSTTTTYKVKIAK